MKNYGYCNLCLKLVPLSREEREGKIFLVKECEDCGRNETLISSDARKYNLKNSLDGLPAQDDCETDVCKIHCPSCKSHKIPNMVFLDVTNRCNMNCPICANNTPAMGFTFEPPLDYFEKIFDYCTQLEPRPSIQLFGGEPTVREDLLDIIRMAKQAKLRIRINTNGIKLADKDYCEELLSTNPTILMAYDGKNPKIYSELRNSPRSLDQKLKAIDNMSKLHRAKVIIMALAAKGYNEHEFSDLLDFCHTYSKIIRGIYFIPLAHTWDHDKLDIMPERITTEDVESMVEEAIPGEDVEFLPAGILARFPVTFGLISDKPLPFGGAHPNCESMTLLVYDGEKYVSLGWFLKKPVYELMKQIIQREGVLKKRLARLENGMTFKFLNIIRLREVTKKLMAYSIIVTLTIKNADLKKIVGEKNALGVFYKGLKILGKIIAGKKPSNVVREETKLKHFLQILIVPFEDKMNIESERLEQCTGHFAYVDPDTEQVKTIPVCSWPFFRKDIMIKTMNKYNL